LDRFTLSLGGRWLGPVAGNTEQATSPVRFSLLAARATLGYRFFGPLFELGPLLSVSAGSIRSKQSDSTFSPRTEVWAALAAGGIALVRLHPYISLTSELELEVPFTQTTFVLSDGSEIYKVSVGARAGLGLRIFFAPK
jgi:hypothetical protein